MDYSSIGFITPEGDCIDSSGRSQGSGMSGRIIDHKQIASEALEFIETAFNSVDEMLQYFIELTGDVRVINAQDSLNIQVPIKKGIPTQKQLSILEQMASKKRVYFDITGEKGRRLVSGEGPFYVFLNSLKVVAEEEKKLKQDLKSKKVPRQLQPLADFVRENFPTKEDYKNARFNPEHPLYQELRKVSDKVGLGVNKVWLDFGFNHQGEFYDAVMGK